MTIVRNVFGVKVLLKERDMTMNRLEKVLVLITPNHHMLHGRLHRILRDLVGLTLRVGKTKVPGIPPQVHGAPRVGKAKTLRTQSTSSEDDLICRK